MNQEISLQKLFNTDNPVIGMIHFAPLIGYPDHPGYETVLSLAFQDLQALEDGGVDAIMLENNYDLPHRELLEPHSIAMLTKLSETISNKTTLPLGLSVLWNDYKTALAISAVTRVSFVRVPVFVDSVETQYGKMYAHPQEVIAYRTLIGCNDIAIFTDIHVKHATMLEDKTIAESAKQAMDNGSDGIIITGKWTADAPNTSDLSEAREAVGNFPILVGSGATTDNIQTLLSYANGVIIGTALKTGKNKDKETETNIKPWEERIDAVKTKRFVTTFNNAIKKGAES